MHSFAASVVDQVEVHWTQVPIAVAAEIPKIGGALELEVYLQEQKARGLKFYKLLANWDHLKYFALIGQRIGKEGPIWMTRLGNPTKNSKLTSSMQVNKK
jgi:hypothetical protein